jgi:hypothetical protein
MNEQSKEDSTMTKQEALLRVEELRKECGVNTFFQKLLADCINILNDLDEPTLPVDLARECFVKGWRACASWTQQAKAPAQQPEVDEGWDLVTMSDIEKARKALREMSTSLGIDPRRDGLQDHGESFERILNFAERFCIPAESEGGEG